MKQKPRIIVSVSNQELLKDKKLMKVCYDTVIEYNKARAKETKCQTN